MSVLLSSMLSDWSWIGVAIETARARRVTILIYLPYAALRLRPLRL